MKNKIVKMILLFVAAIFIGVIVWHTPCLAQGETERALQIQIKAVSILPYIDARYKTIKLIPKGDYQSWQMDAGSSFSKQVVDSPNQKDGIFVEVLAFIKNVSANNERFEFNNPELKLTDGRSIPPWEYLIAGLAEDYDGIVNYLQLTDSPPVKGMGTIHLLFGGGIYSNLESSQQTWVIFIFQVPKYMKMAKLVIGSYPTVTIRIPNSKKQ